MNTDRFEHLAILSQFRNIFQNSFGMDNKHTAMFDNCHVNELSQETQDYIYTLTNVQDYNAKVLIKSVDVKAHAAIHTSRNLDKARWILIVQLHGHVTWLCLYCVCF